MLISAPRVWRYNQQRRKYLGEVGMLVGFSVVRVGPVGLENRTPYVVGLVEVGGEKIMVQIVDIAKPRIGMKVVGVVRRLFDVDPEAVVVYGIKFRPVI
jgi:uncharacterized OB-fold protein